MLISVPRFNSIFLLPQINIIRDQCEQVKELIASHENEGKESVELCLQNLRVKPEELETLKSENSRFLQDNNVVEVIQGGSSVQWYSEMA